MQQPILFATPLWTFNNPLPKGAYDWALKYQKENPESVVISNRGGYQSKQQGIDKFPYALHLRGILKHALVHPSTHYNISDYEHMHEEHCLVCVHFRCTNLILGSTFDCNLQCPRLYFDPSLRLSCVIYIGWE